MSTSPTRGAWEKYYNGRTTPYSTNKGAYYGLGIHGHIIERYAEPRRQRGDAHGYHRRDFILYTRFFA
jgi:hypothetical protein